ncbi:unnamed protein product [Staurois parvus]|uniref:Uncharacterized protein n=1 Tax=Staurois parvus TaxID=386267 RepID=A0ABN9EJ16_9NEOB|nr:unnamed protein product [Staurois parvus]
MGNVSSLCPGMNKLLTTVTDIGSMNTLQEMVRDCRHTTGDGQRLQTHYRRWSETADTLQEMVRDCRHSTGDDQRLQT